MRTCTQERLLGWEGCSNARDLGGYRTRDGGRTRWRAVVRSDCPTRLTPRGRTQLVEYGVRTVLDLRELSELEAAPNPFAGCECVRYVNVPVEDSDDPDGAAAMEAAATIEEAYVIGLERYPERLARAVRAVAGADEGCVLVHCAAGKDRTGLVCALLLGLVGVPDEVVAEDWNLSNRCLREQYGRAVRTIPHGTHERLRLERQLRTSEPTMLAMLSWLRARHGGVEGYLRAGGLSAEDARRLRERLVDRAGT